MAIQLRSSTRLAALSALLALPILPGCKTSEDPTADAGPGDGDSDGEPGDGNDADGSGDGQSELDAGDGDAADGDPADGDAADGDSGTDGDPADGDSGAGGDGDAGPDGDPGDPLAPWELDCANLPAPTVDGCVAGPREVLLAIDETGLVAMLDPVDGHFLGYFKRPHSSYYVDYVEEYWFATQGPDQCIWTVTESSDALYQDDDGNFHDERIQRWTTDGELRDSPLQPHYIPVPGSTEVNAINSPLSLAFTGDKVYVSSGYFPVITRWNVADGSFDQVVEEDGVYVSSLLALGDGSLLIADDSKNRIARIPAGGGAQTPVLGGVSWTAQIAYAGDGKVLATDTDLGRTPVHKVDIEEGTAQSVVQNYQYSSNKWGVAQLENGRWLVVDGQTGIVSIDPASSNPSGQFTRVYEGDPAVEAVNFKHIGRACLPTAFVESRAPKPANDTCMEQPSGASLFEENFQGDDDFEGAGKQRHYHAFYDHGTTGVTSSLVADPTDSSNRVLKVEGAGALSVGGVTRTHKTGVYATFAALKPSYVSYRIYAGSSAEDGLGYFALQNAEANTYQYDQLAGQRTYNGYLYDWNSNATTYPTVLSEKWIKVEMRNIDWETRTYDLHVQYAGVNETVCKRLADRIGLPLGLGDNFDLLDLYNWSDSPTANTVAYYDDIIIK